MVLFLFFCSGATALIYEVLWSKYLSLIFGSTVHAQTVVLSVFMGGLALGNWLFGRRSKAMRQPLVAYGYVELGIAVYAFCFEWIYNCADSLFVALGRSLLDQTFALLLLKGLLSVGMLLVPTVLMGGTLPMLAAWLQQNRSESERLSARFYSVNSLGAVFGSALAGFYLIRTVGLVSTAQVAALVNALVGSCAIGLGRRKSQEAARACSASAATGSATQSDPRQNQSAPLLRWTSLLVAITGGTSMGLEVLASRALSLVFGSSLQAFALVLIAFILGIGLGSSAVASAWWRRRIPSGVTPLLLIGASAWILLLVFRIEGWVEFYRWARTGLAPSEMGYFYHQWLIVFAGLFVLGLPAALIGAVLPLMMQTASHHDALGAHVGRLLTWNTMGAVVGVLLSGFVLMPVLGLRNAFALLAFGLCATALGYAALRGQRIASACSGLAAIAAVVVFSVGNEEWRVVLSSGAFRNRSTVYDPTIMQQRNEQIKIVYYKDAPDATVSVERSVKSGELFLRVNGKTDASSHGDLSTQMLLGHLGLMARPEAKDVFVLGLGSGITGGAVLAHPVQSLTVAENCKPVIEAAKIFQPFNYDVLSDPRTRIVPEDGRTILKLSPKQYDVIISEPSNPWTAGIGSVFSREYYKLAASKLAPGGVMVQWFHVYEMHDGIVSMVLRTFSEVFPHLEIWDAHGGDIILMGGRGPWTPNVDAWRRTCERPLVRQQLEMIGLGTPEQLLARQLASQRTAFAIAGDGPVQSDYFPMLEYEAPKAFFIGKEATLLRNYDERTVQTALLPVAKQQVLASLEDAPLRAAFFSGFQSVNLDLTKILSARLNTNAMANLSSNIPSVFQRASHSRAPETIRSLGDQFQAAIPQLEGPDTRQAAVLRLRDLMDYAQKNGVPSALYAAQAARQLLACADYAGAKVFLEIGLAADQNEPQLNYIARILEREHSKALASAK